MKSYNISYPLKDNVTTNEFLAANIITKDSYSSNLILLLLTQIGERYYNPDYGTNLLKYVFEPNDSLTASEIEKELKDTVSKYIPEIKITTVTFDWQFDDEGNPISDNQLNVNIKFVYQENYFKDEGNINIKF
jgi:phage baseplate assembly protein W